VSAAPTKRKRSSRNRKTSREKRSAVYHKSQGARSPGVLEDCVLGISIALA
jgi:hypothetical protein